MSAAPYRGASPPTVQTTLYMVGPSIGFIVMLIVPIFAIWWTTRPCRSLLQRPQVLRPWAGSLQLWVLSTGLLATRHLCRTISHATPHGTKGVTQMHDPIDWGTVLASPLIWGSALAFLTPIITQWLVYRKHQDSLRAEIDAKEAELEA